MKNYVVKNLINSGAVVIAGDIKDISALIVNLMNINKKNELNYKEFNTLELDKRKNKTALKNFQHYILPEAIPFRGTQKLKTNCVDWNYLSKVSIEEVNEKVIFENIQFDKITDDLNKVFFINRNKIVSVKSNLSSHQIKEVIFKSLEKFILDEELYYHRLDLWRKQYVEAEARGEVVLKAFKESTPRPAKGKTEISEIVYATTQKPVNLNDLFDLRDYDIKDFLVNPYLMMQAFGSPFNFKQKNSIVPKDEITQNHNQESFIKDLHNMRIESLRETLAKKNIEIKSFKENMDQAVSELQKRWEQNLTDVIPDKGVA